MNSTWTKKVCTAMTTVLCVWMLNTSSFILSYQVCTHDKINHEHLGASPSPTYSFPCIASQATHIHKFPLQKPLKKVVLKNAAYFDDLTWHGPHWDLLHNPVTCGILVRHNRLGWGRRQLGTQGCQCFLGVSEKSNFQRRGKIYKKFELGGLTKWN